MRKEVEKMENYAFYLCKNGRIRAELLRFYVETDENYKIRLAKKAMLKHNESYPIDSEHRYEAIVGMETIEAKHSYHDFKQYTLQREQEILNSYDYQKRCVWLFGKPYKLNEDNTLTRLSVKEYEELTK